MKKIKKNDLRLEKEVIALLDEKQLQGAKGGANNSVDICESYPVGICRTFPCKDTNNLCWESIGCNPTQDKCPATNQTCLACEPASDKCGTVMYQCATGTCLPATNKCLVWSVDACIKL